MMSLSSPARTTIVGIPFPLSVHPFAHVLSVWLSSSPVSGGPNSSYSFTIPAGVPERRQHAQAKSRDLRLKTMVPSRSSSRVELSHIANDSNIARGFSPVNQSCSVMAICLLPTPKYSTRTTIVGIPFPLSVHPFAHVAKVISLRASASTALTALSIVLPLAPGFSLLPSTSRPSAVAHTPRQLPHCKAVSVAASRCNESPCSWIPALDGRRGRTADAFLCAAIRP